MSQFLLIIAVSSAISFGAGFMASDWRNGAEIARLESRSAVAESANGQCQTDVASVRQSVAGMVKDSEDRAKKAEAAMLDAQAKAMKHSATAITIKAAPIREGESECDA